MTPPPTLLVTHATELCTVAGSSRTPRTGSALADPGRIRDGAVAVAGDTILAVGPTDRVLADFPPGPDTRVLDASGRVVLPGLVDPHTHLVHAGSREGEFVQRLQGRSYLEILAAGGGILATVAATRAASAASLEVAARAALDRMLVHGATTVEAKSGYGLTLADEVKQLRVVANLDRSHPVDLVPTFLAAHAVPPEFRGRRSDYVRHVVEAMLPAVAGLAEFCDVFCETEVFPVSDAREILAAGRRLGLRPKLHADELGPSGGSALAAELGATSADHCIHTPAEVMPRLAAAGVVVVLLPGTSFTLGARRWAPARAFVAAGVPVALATDYNPGTSPVDSMVHVMGIACRGLGLTPAEAISAATINAAHAVGRAGKVGSLEPGKQADLVAFDAPSADAIPYYFGSNRVDWVIKAGRVVVSGGRLVQAAGREGGSNGGG